MLHVWKEVSFVSIIIFTLFPDALSLNGRVTIINQSINQSINQKATLKTRLIHTVVYQTCISYAEAVETLVAAPPLTEYSCTEPFAEVGY